MVTAAQCEHTKAINCTFMTTKWYVYFATIKIFFLEHIKCAAHIQNVQQHIYKNWKDAEKISPCARI